LERSLDSVNVYTDCENCQSLYTVSGKTEVLLLPVTQNQVHNKLTHMTRILQCAYLGPKRYRIFFWVFFCPYV